MVYCGKCGSSIKEGMGHCDKCGEPIDPRLIKDNIVKQDSKSTNAGQSLKQWDCSVCGEAGNTDNKCRNCGTSNPEYARQVFEENKQKSIKQEEAAKLRKERAELLRNTNLYSIFDEHDKKVMQVRAKSKTEAIELAQNHIGNDINITASVRIIDYLKFIIIGISIGLVVSIILIAMLSGTRVSVNETRVSVNETRVSVNETRVLAVEVIAYRSPSFSSAELDRLPRGTKIQVTEKINTNGEKWLRIQYKPPNREVIATVGYIAGD